MTDRPASDPLPAAYEARVDGPLAARGRRAARLGGSGALARAEAAAVARSRDRLARDLVAAIAAGRAEVCLRVRASGRAAVRLAERRRALTDLRRRAVG